MQRGARTISEILYLPGGDGGVLRRSQQPVSNHLHKVGGTIGAKFFAGAKWNRPTGFLHQLGVWPWGSSA